MNNIFLQKLGQNIIRLIISSFAVSITAWLLEGVHIGEPQYLNALLIAVTLSLLNSFVKPILLFFSIPITFFSFGLFLLVINAVIILMAGNIIEAFKVDSFWWAIGFSIILSITTAILDGIGRAKIHRFKKDKNDDLNNQVF